MSIEEAEYTVLHKEQKFEVREYAPKIVAETIVNGDFKDAGSLAFDRLFKYISGNNTTEQKIKMTSPVAQKAEGEKISMTAPVSQQQSNGNWAVSFMMPASYSLDTLPTPKDPRVVLKEIPAQYMAVVRYSGFWSEKNYIKHKQKLDNWIQDKNYSVIAEPIWARYNPPFTPWFLRRNEILVAIEKP